MSVEITQYENGCVKKFPITDAPHRGFWRGNLRVTETQRTEFWLNDKLIRVEIKLFWRDGKRNLIETTVQSSNFKAA